MYDAHIIHFILVNWLDIFSIIEVTQTQVYSDLYIFLQL